MKTKNLLYFTSTILIIFYIFGSSVYSEASIRENNFKMVIFGSGTFSEKIWLKKIMFKVFDGGKDSAQPQIKDPEGDYIKLAVNDVGRRPCPDLLQWNTEIDNKLFQINVNRDDETVIIRGEANDWEQREKIEHIIKLRAPSNFQIINEIDIYKIDLQNKELG